VSTDAKKMQDRTKTDKMTVEEYKTFRYCNFRSQLWAVFIVKLLTA
jgi:hypothetical protein